MTIFESFYIHTLLYFTLLYFTYFTLLYFTILTMGIYKLIIACASYLPSIIGKILICLAMAVCTGIGFIHVMVYHKTPVISAPAYRSTFLYRPANLETKPHFGYNSSYF